jgi:hypothetical protein
MHKRTQPVIDDPNAGSLLPGGGRPAPIRQETSPPRCPLDSEEPNQTEPVLHERIALAHWV